MKKTFIFLFSAMILVSLVSMSHAVVLSQGRSIVKIGEDINMGERLSLDDLVAIKGNIDVKGNVRNDVLAVLGTVHLYPTARVGGDVTVISGKLIRDPGARIAGNVIETAAGVASPAAGLPAMAIMPINPIVGNLAVFLGFIGLTMLFAALMTRQVGIVSSYIERSPIKSLLWGILAGLLILPAALLLALTLIGIPLILVEVVLVSFTMAVGLVAMAQLIGKKATRTFRMPNRPMIVEAVVGMVILSLVNLAPVVGCMICGIFAVMGFGAATATRLGSRKM